MATNPNIQSILQGILTATDNTQSPAPYVVNLDFQNPSMLSTSYFFEAFLPAATGGGTAVPLGTGATTAAYLIVVINRSTVTNSNVEIFIEPSGGTLVEVGTIGPGGVFVVMDTPQSGVGWTALTLIGETAIVPCTVYAANQG